ncbi:Piso0_003466 [Millerozyma farinosa CBS 7064]|uniref:S-methyl-5'-thioadenosine phosphorylase n=1 Tax=Pichia sorbitophila (strain ATCC MYA-4447 / BCRC 22081 / CBS 7064 / NBRC 10061 / NRRL Y-12695) TaxID=559304 RepID=G8YJ55_PICSO|nr:Piso0_003466 [Millerozyma farinosa CBS 7064]CCE81115.1 Piso0_003466 [Millerozyma farinosa CBS 7064]
MKWRIKPRINTQFLQRARMSKHRENISISQLPHEFNEPVEFAIIGGTGLYDLPHLTPVARLTISTPWGHPSSPITISRNEEGFPIAFLARHGHHHDLLPSDVPSRANIAALKKIGVRAIVAFSAVGSLQQEIKPRDFVLPTQIIDRTKGIRPSTFFEKGFVAHAMFGEPFDLKLNKLIADNIPTSGFLDSHENKEGKPIFHTKQHTHKGEDLTVVCMEGPQFSTRAESKLYRSWGGSVINMSVLPEAKLAREAEIAYQMICMSTDYDSWNESEEPVTVETVVGNLKANSANAAKLTLELVKLISKEFSTNSLGIGEDLKGSMKYSVSTNPNAVSKELLQKMHYLFPGYWPVH